MEAIIAGTYSLKRFLQKTPGTEKHKDKWKTQSRYSVAMATPFFHIFIHADVVNAQSWEVSPQKNPVEQP